MGCRRRDLRRSSRRRQILSQPVKTQSMQMPCAPPGVNPTFEKGESSSSIYWLPGSVSMGSPLASGSSASPRTGASNTRGTARTTETCTGHSNRQSKFLVPTGRVRTCRKRCSLHASVQCCPPASFSVGTTTSVQRGSVNEHAASTRPSAEVSEDGSYRSRCRPSIRASRSPCRKFALLSRTRL